MSVQTIDSKKNDFIEHAKKAFNEKNLNYARQAAEAFCKIILLKEYGEDSDVLSQYRRFNGRITYIFDEKLIDKKVKAYLITLQSHGNILSHDDDVSKLDEHEINIGLSCLSQLVSFLYKDYFDENIPFEIKEPLSHSEDKEKPIVKESLNDIEESNVSVKSKPSTIEGSLNRIKNSTISIG